MFCVDVKKATDHPLVLCIMFRRFLLKEFDAAFAQRQRNFHAFVTKH